MPMRPPAVTDDTDKPVQITIRLADGERRDGAAQELSDSERREIETILELNDKAKLDAFCREIGNAVGYFRLQRDMPSLGGSHKTDRKALLQLKKAAERLQKDLDELPASALKRLDLALQALAHEERRQTRTDDVEDAAEFHISAMPAVTAETGNLLSGVETGLPKIAAAIEFIETYTRTKSGGRPLDAPMAILANRTANAFMDVLEETPTTTVSGRYEQILKVALTAGWDTDAWDRDLHSFVRKTLEGIKPL